MLRLLIATSPGRLVYISNSFGVVSIFARLMSPSPIRRCEFYSVCRFAFGGNRILTVGLSMYSPSTLRQTATRSSTSATNCCSDTISSPSSRSVVFLRLAIDSLNVSQRRDCVNLNSYLIFTIAMLCPGILIFRLPPVGVRACFEDFFTVQQQHECLIILKKVARWHVIVVLQRSVSRRWRISSSGCSKATASTATRITILCTRPTWLRLCITSSVAVDYRYEKNYCKLFTV